MSFCRLQKKNRFKDAAYVYGYAVYSPSLLDEHLLLLGVDFCPVYLILYVSPFVQNLALLGCTRVCGKINP